MSLKITVRQVDGVTILDCVGNITLGEGDAILRDIVRDLVVEGKIQILLNLAEVSYIDNSGISGLVEAFTTVTNHGGTLKLVHIRKRLQDILQITKLYTVFEICEDEAVAVRNFGN